MRNRLFLAGIGAATIISGAAFTAVLFAANPESTDLPLKILFFLSLALFLTGLLSIILYRYSDSSSKAKDNETLVNFLREAFLFSVWFVGFLALSAVFGFVPGGIVALLVIGIFMLKKRNLFWRKK